MAMPGIETFVVEAGTPELATCARWRSDAFPVLEADYERERRSLEAFTSDREHQVALIVKLDGIPVGTCLLVRSELEPNHAVTPWLAGLFVVGEYRRLGAGAALVRAIEAQARRRGFRELFLYTTSAAGFYERLGWATVDHTMWKGLDTAFMRRPL